MRLSSILISVSLTLFSGCAKPPEPRYIIKRCEIAKPMRPIRGEYNSEFDYLKAVFVYVLDLESRAEACD